MKKASLRGINTKVVFLSICIATVTVIVDTSLVRTYRFIVAPIPLNLEIVIFIIISTIYIITQYLLLKFSKVDMKAEKNSEGGILHLVVSVLQLTLAILLIFIILEMILVSSYHISIVATAVSISYVLASYMSAVLAFRFFSWFKYSRNVVVLAYNVAAAGISVNTAFTLVYVIQALQDVSAIVIPHTGHITGFASYYSILNSGYLTTSIISFTAVWIATILLMRHHSNKLGATKYWILVTVPLVYFLSQFQPSFLDLFSVYRISNPILFDILYTIIFNLSKPVGGILFGIAFWIVARSIQQTMVKAYLMTAGYGLLLFFASNQAIVLINSPYPPFGIAASAFVGLSCYLMLIGVYYSAVSVSEDVQLRKSIRNSVESQLSLLDRIGSAEMEKKIMNNVLRVTRNLSEQTGVEPSLNEEDINNYLAEVIKETREVNK